MVNFGAQSIRQTLVQILGFAAIFTSSYMFYKGLSIVANSESPLVVVLSGSMEPAYQRGDVLLLWNRQKHVDVGEVVVYNIEGRTTPIVHRVLRSHASDNKQLLLTKGDNNAVDDVSFYGGRNQYLDREKEVVGVVKGYLPLVGYITILLAENQYFKYGLLGITGLLAFIQGE